MLASRILPRIAPMARLAAAPLRATTPVQMRTITSLQSVAYTASAEASGQGRNGTAKLVGDDGNLELKLAMPKALGGAGDGNNPEQLFALGYSACFLSALNLVARTHGISLPPNVRCKADVHIGKPQDAEGFAIAVDLHLTSEAKTDHHQKTFKEAVQLAHEACPYSKATAGNINVNLHVE